ncbi:transposase [Streptomyces sp. NPDC005828]|uniref:IS110 family transposase n=1 Tax=Streptomyces sp. NPDC005828 TaxID=3157071 RepID=UPI0033D7B375
MLLAHQEFPATSAGYRQLLAWASPFGSLRRAGVECTGSYGSTPARFLSRESLQVVEVDQPDPATRRKRGKTDTIDAAAAARAVLSRRADVTPKTGEGPAADMRVLRLAKESVVKTRTPTRVTQDPASPDRRLPHRHRSGHQPADSALRTSAVRARRPLKALCVPLPSKGRRNPWTDPRKITYRVAPRPEMNGRRRVPCGSHLSSAPSSAVPAWFANSDRERSKQPVSRRNP